jgi:CheY-like chemotaxis protein
MSAALKIDQRPVVILVDDYEDNLVLYKKRIELDTDYRVLTASTGRQLFDLIRQHSGIAAILLDINLPGELGTRLAAEVKQQRPGMPVALVTAYVLTSAMKEDAKAAGVPVWDKLEIANAHELSDRLEKLLHPGERN